MLLTERMAPRVGSGTGPTCTWPGSTTTEGGGTSASPRVASDDAVISWCPNQLVARHPGVIFFSAAYLAAASLTMGAITLSSDSYQSDVMLQFLPSQVWMRPVRAPSWSLHDTLIGLSAPSKPSCLMRSAERLRFSRPQRTCSPVSGFLPNFSCAVRIASSPSIASIRPRTYRISPVSSHFAMPLPLSYTNFLR